MCEYVCVLQSNPYPCYILFIGSKLNVKLFGVVKQNTTSKQNPCYCKYLTVFAEMCMQNNNDSCWSCQPHWIKVIFCSRKRHSFIFCNRLFLSSGVTGVTSSHRAAWMSRQPIAGPHRIRQPFTLTPTDNLEFPNSLTCMFLDCGMKVENPERTHKDRHRNNCSTM